VDNNKLIQEASELADKVVDLYETMSKAFGDEYEEYHLKLAILTGLRQAMSTAVQVESLGSAIYHMTAGGVSEAKSLARIMPNAKDSYFVYVPRPGSGDLWDPITRHDAEKVAGLITQAIPVYTVVELMEYLPVINVFVGNRPDNTNVTVTCNKWHLSATMDTIPEALAAMVVQLHGCGATWDLYQGV